MFEKPETLEQQAIPGQPLKDLAATANIPLKYSCMQGTCGICDVKVDGIETPACTAKMPARDCVIEYKATKQAQEYMKERIKAQKAAKKAGLGAQSGVVQPTKKPMTRLEQMLAEENAAKAAAKKEEKKWPFG